MAESEEELRSLLMKVNYSEKIGLKLNIQKTILSHAVSDAQPVDQHLSAA